MDVQLRPFTRDDVAILQRFASDPAAAGTYNWTGFATRTRRGSGSTKTVCSPTRLDTWSSSQTARAWERSSGDQPRMTASLPAAAGGSAVRSFPSTVAAGSVPPHIVNSSTTCCRPLQRCASRPTPRLTTPPNAAASNVPDSSRKVFCAASRSATVPGETSSGTASYATTISPTGDTPMRDRIPAPTERESRRSRRHPLGSPTPPVTAAAGCPSCVISRATADHRHAAQRGR